MLYLVQMHNKRRSSELGYLMRQDLAFAPLVKVHHRSRIMVISFVYCVSPGNGS